MLNKILYIIALILLITAIYSAYVWYQTEPDNREILPTALSLSSSCITVFIASRMKNNSNNSVRVGSVSESTVDIDPKDNTDISVKRVRKNSKVLINKGKDTLKNNS